MNLFQKDFERGELERMANRYAFDYNRETGIIKYIQWDNHCPEDGAIVTEQDPRIKNAILEENLRLRNENRTLGKDSPGMIGNIPLEDFLQIQKDHPEVMEFKGLERAKWWRNYLATEGRKFSTTEKIWKKGLRSVSA